MYVLLVIFGLAWTVSPIVALVLALRARNELHVLRDRLDSLEADLEPKLDRTPAILPAPSPTAALDAAAASAHFMATLMAPVPIEPAVPLHEAAVPVAAVPLYEAAVPVAVPPTPVVAAPTPLAPATPPVEVSAPPRKRLDSERLEQLIGGIWLQNVGSVLLLLGTFFLIVWGYTQHKFGPEVLVAAGVAFGAILAWRGDRIARSIRPLGHALLGVGLGVVYITVYLGHFQMSVLPGGITFALLALLSFVTVDIGLRRRQAVIASFGVAGAFVPLLMASLSGPGFNLSPPALLGYFVVVNAVVFALTATRGWSGLVLMSLVCTSMTWVMHTKGVMWGLPTQLGVSALFVALGMAPVVRLARSRDPVRGIDLAVVSLAPLLLIIATFTYFAATKRMAAGGLLTGLGLVNIVAAVWIDSRRSERDLWRPLTAAATIFLAAALERFLASEYLSLAWCIEGAALVWLGLAPRGGWIRGLGYGLSGIAFMRIFYFASSYNPTAGGGMGIFNGAALRDLLCILAFLVVSDRVGRKRESLTENERAVPGMWVGVTNALIMAWFFHEAPYLARWFGGPGTPAALVGPQPSAAPPRPAVDSVLVVGLAWTVQSSLLVFLAQIRRAPVLRHVGYLIALIAFVPFLISLSEASYWRAGNVPVFYPAGLLMLVGVAWIVGTAVFLWSRRSTLGETERHAPSIWVIAANLSLLLWISREAGHVASVAGAGTELTAAILSLLWSVHAGTLLLLASSRRIPLLRFIGYVIGLMTLFPFLVAITGDRYWKAGDLPVLYPAGLLTLACTAALTAMAAFLWSRRESLAGKERRSPEIGLILANGLLLGWLWREAQHAASVAGPGSALTAPLLAFLWAAHAAALVFLASSRRIPLLRYIGYIVGLLAVVPFLEAITGAHYWRTSDLPLLYPAGLLTLACAAALMAIPAFLWSRRASLGPDERRAPEVALILSNFLLLLWTSYEAGHVASAFAPGTSLTASPSESTSMFTAGITSGAWMLQAGVLLAIGWARRSAFVRWMGLGLVGLTLSKFVLFDLRNVDVFWRFVLALGVGAVLLLLSFVYQRQNRSRKLVEG